MSDSIPGTYLCGGNPLLTEILHDIKTLSDEDAHMYLEKKFEELESRQKQENNIN